MGKILLLCQKQPQHSFCKFVELLFQWSKESCSLSCSAKVEVLVCVAVDYMHSETSATPLMIAAGRGFTNVVEQLLNLGASVHIRASNDWTAVDWAKKFEWSDIIELLEAHA